jgi:hypothetical protein
MLPAVAVTRMTALEGQDGKYDPKQHGSILVVEEDDVLDQIFDELTLLDLQEGWNPFEYVVAVQEERGRVFEAVMSLGGDAAMVLIVPDESWLHPELRTALESVVLEE